MRPLAFVSLGLAVTLAYVRLRSPPPPPDHHKIAGVRALT